MCSKENKERILADLAESGMRPSAFAKARPGSPAGAARDTAPAAPRPYRSKSASASPKSSKPRRSTSGCEQ